MGALVVIVIGVSGSGKSTVGRALAEEMSVPFLDGDELHTAASIAKMAAGRPLDDEDRLPWLASLAVRVGEMAAADGGVIACSALKRKYRDALLAAAPTVRFLQLAVDKEAAWERVAARVDHFMPAALVESQFCEYEPLQRGEPGMIVDAMRELAEKVEAFEEYLSSPARRNPEGDDLER
ncbi:gluconokinase, GntK/IdnK-type [Actinospica sp.]|jgi:gluconokinase|uniref:gluconokinase n=1 Tax=Actinospica sp. TaxID=1872142 RepID=UPI002BF3ECA6|nr:gluconokinase, GntK/IdnK-type [Actinospica sp.]HWG25625.1 gluconokinase, GntK/IdnK-type [Actinospica sp.]